MNETLEEYTPIPVHVVSSSVPVKKKRQKRTVFNTVILTSADSVQQLLPQSDLRVCAYVQAIDNDVVLASSVSQGQAKSNTASGVPFPSGTYLPKANTAPYRIEGNEAIWVAATTTGSNTRVAVSATYWVD